MKSPITGKEMILKKEYRTLTFRKESFDVMYHYFLCEDSKEQFTNKELDEINLIQLYNRYREAHHLPFPDEIIAIREKYKLPAIKMAEILGFGVNVYRNYENGEVPSESNARLIQLAKDPRKFKDLVEISKVYEGDELLKVSKHIDKLIEENRKVLVGYNLQDYLLGPKQPDIFTGYKVPSLEKFTEMVVYFTQELKPWKTKLNKLLFYADFLCFKRTCFSISGMRYRAIDMGPVPNNFNSIFEYIANQDDVDIYQTEFEEGKIGEQFKPNAERKFNSDLFTEDELKILKEVTLRLGEKTGTNDIINISHKEKAWIKNFEAGKKLIKYSDGFELEAF
jgi:putative zinc finger/helix-turn-helix YgiT family protein